MTSWVITIDKGHPQHWGIAKRHGFWDMTKFFRIKQGDTLYFWQGGKSMLSQCRATTSAHRITTEHETPWEDSGERLYRARVTFRVLSEEPYSQPQWTELKNRMTDPKSLQTPREFTDSRDEAVLATLFASEPWLPSEEDEARQSELDALGLDLRKYDIGAIHRRQGQGAFRRELLRAYGGRCAVTGSDTVDVLEAAHISPYRGAHSHLVKNGLLLRSDIHTLFDLERITVLPRFTVSVHPELRYSDYQHLHGRRLAVVPEMATLRPHVDLLKQHNDRCEWAMHR